MHDLRSTAPRWSKTADRGGPGGIRPRVGGRGSSGSWAFRSRVSKSSLQTGTRTMPWCTRTDRGGGDVQSGDHGPSIWADCLSGPSATSTTDAAGADAEFPAARHKAPAELPGRPDKHGRFGAGRVSRGTETGRVSSGSAIGGHRHRGRMSSGSAGPTAWWGEPNAIESAGESAGRAEWIELKDEIDRRRRGGGAQVRGPVRSPAALAGRVANVTSGSMTHTDGGSMRVAHGRWRGSTPSRCSVTCRQRPARGSRGACGAGAARRARSSCCALEIESL